MHNALLISEILGCIIDHLKRDTAGQYPTSSTQETRLALAALARTCRVFSEPALNALWCRLDSLKPFLPASLFSVDGELDDEQWNVIVSRHASRVRELRVGRDDFDRLLYFRWTHGTPLLPNLRKLFWWIEEVAPICFLGPSLVHLYVWLGQRGSDLVMGFLECYHILCPNLKSLYLGHSGHLSNVKTALSRAITRSPNLTALVCHFIDEAAVIHIANSPHLKKLRAILHEHDLRKLAVHFNPDHPPFQNLRSIELHVKDLFSFIPFLTSHQQPFEVVNFRSEVAPTPEVLCEFFTALGSTTRRRTLREVSVSAPRSAKGGTPLGAVDFQVLSPLVIFNLRMLEVNLLNPITLTDDELGRLVQAWPDLETFHLTQARHWDHRSIADIPTLRGLLLVVKRCPKLRNLGLLVDARTVPSLSGAESSICSTTVTTLFVADSPLKRSEVGRVAQFLLGHFPALVQVRSRTWFSLWYSVLILMEETSGRSLTPEESESEYSDEDEIEIEIDSDSESVY